jgi:hypothetical protein
MNIATRHTRFLADAATLSVNGGEPIMVCGIVAANTAAGGPVTVELTDAAGTAIMTIEVGASSTVTQEAPWLADAGLAITAGAASTIVTVLWRPSG